MARRTFEVDHLGQISSARIEFGDITVLVGPQGSGKSLLTQLWKFALDGPAVRKELQDAGIQPTTSAEWLDAYLGHGMHQVWRPKTRVKVDGHPWDLQRALRKNKGEGVFVIPAHRSMLVADGWPAPFQKHSPDTPVVARMFSQRLYDIFTSRAETTLFPRERVLKEEYRKIIDAAVFHGGEVRVEQEGVRRRLGLRFPRTQEPLPFMTWTAGQREFAPLLLGLYHLLPSRRKSKAEGVSWVVVEEPEMGLHPQAVVATVLLLLDLVWRGYKVIVTTHSPLVLDAIWCLRRVAAEDGKAGDVAAAFGVASDQGMRPVLTRALEAEKRVFAFSFGDRGVTSEDISELDPFSERESERDWGGLTGFSARFSEAVATAVARRERSGGTA